MIIIRNCKSESGWADAGVELSLDEMLADPIVRLLMARDGVSEHDVRRVMSEAAQRRRLRAAAE